MKVREADGARKAARLEIFKSVKAVAKGEPPIVRETVHWKCAAEIEAEEKKITVFSLLNIQPESVALRLRVAVAAAEAFRNAIAEAAEINKPAFEKQLDAEAKKRRDWVESIPFFQELVDTPACHGRATEFITLVAESLVDREYSSGHDIIVRGDVGDEMFILLSGTARVVTDEGIPVVNLSVGDNFGELGLLSDAPRSATVRAEPGAAMLSVLTKAQLKTVMSKFEGMTEGLQKQQWVAQVQFFKQLIEAHSDKMGDQMTAGTEGWKFLKHVAAALLKKEYPAGKKLIGKGEVGREMYIVMKGAVDIMGGDGDKDVTVTLYEGANFGEMALLNDAPRGATVRASTNGPVELYALEQHEFKRVMSLFPSMGNALEFAQKLQRQQWVSEMPFFKDLVKSRAKELGNKANVAKFFKQVADALVDRQYYAGQEIIKKGTVGKEMYFVVTGQVDVVLESGAIVARIGASQFFGEMALLNDSPRTATVRASTDWKGTIDLCVLAKSDLQKVMDLFPGMEDSLKQKEEEKGSVLQIMQLIEFMGLKSADELEAEWNKSDQDGNGTLDLKEVTAFIQRVSPSYLRIDALVVESCFKQMDADGSGVIDFEEICSFFGVKVELASVKAFMMGKNKEQMREIFAKLDDDQSGLIDQDEVRIMIETICKTDVPDSVVDALFLQMDEDGSGEVDFEEFCDYFGVAEPETEPETEPEGQSVEEVRREDAASAAAGGDQTRQRKKLDRKLRGKRVQRQKEVAETEEERAHRLQKEKELSEQELFAQEQRKKINVRLRQAQHCLDEGRPHAALEVLERARLLEPTNRDILRTLSEASAACTKQRINEARDAATAERKNLEEEDHRYVQLARRRRENLQTRRTQRLAAEAASKTKQAAYLKEKAEIERLNRLRRQDEIQQETVSAKINDTYRWHQVLCPSSLGTLVSQGSRIAFSGGALDSAGAETAEGMRRTFELHESVARADSVSLANLLISAEQEAQENAAMTLRTPGDLASLSDQERKNFEIAVIESLPGIKQEYVKKVTLAAGSVVARVYFAEAGFDKRQVPSIVARTRALDAIRAVQRGEIYVQFRGKALKAEALLPDAATVHKLVCSKGLYGFTALHWATSLGFIKVENKLYFTGPPLVKALLRANAEVDARNEEGAVPIHLAAAHGDTQSISMLLEAGADRDALDGSHKTPLHVAAEAGHSAVCEQLVKAGCEVYTKDLDELCTPLHLAARAGHMRATATLIRLARGSSFNFGVDAPGWLRTTPLHDAASNGREGVIGLLIDARADFMLADEYFEETALHKAAARGCAATTAALLKPPTVVSWLDSLDLKDKYAALAPYVEEWDGAKRKPGKLETVLTLDSDEIEMIVSGWESYEAKRFRAGVIALQKSPADSAARAGGKAAIEALTAAGERAIHRAAVGGHAETVQILIDNGAEIDSLTSDGHTARELATACAIAASESHLLGDAMTQIHVAGIGVDGWDGTPDGVGKFESENALRNIFQPFGHFVGAQVRHLIRASTNIGANSVIQNAR